MSDEKKEAHPPPPPYTPYPASGDATGTRKQSRGSSGTGSHQQQQECTTSQGNSSSLWQRLRRLGASASSTESPHQQTSNSSQHLVWTGASSTPTNCEGEHHRGLCYCGRFLISPPPAGGPVRPPGFRIPTTCARGDHCGTCHCGRFTLHQPPSADQMGVAAPVGGKRKTATATANISSTCQAWQWEKGCMRCDPGAITTKLPLPRRPYTNAPSCLLDITCYPPQPPPATQTSAGARWHQIESVQLTFRSNRMADILREPQIPWRENANDFSYADNIAVTHYPYPILLSNGQSEPTGKAQTHWLDGNPHAMPHGISALSSFGGLCYERSIMIKRQRGNVAAEDWCVWEVCLTISSRDANWLASLKRSKIAALASLDSVASVVGWMYPERQKLSTGVMFYAKTFRQPGREPCDLEPYRCGKPSPLGAAHDEEMRKLVDDGIEMVIRG